ncbi:MAG: hypothetical protein PF517_09950 [Salinivirgaceae bacterium]|jgi:hypothetical protein|nr:hypothetical protein [Salinivirgaceae bacterium]
MRRFLIIFTLILPCLSYAQYDRHQSKIKFDKNRNEIKVSESDYGLLLGAGRSFNYYDKKTSSYKGNTLGLTFKLDAYYKNFFFGLAFKPTTGSLTNQTDTIYFDISVPHETLSLNDPKTTIVIGYSIDLPYNFSFEPYIGLLTTSFFATDENSKEITELNHKARGVTTGFSINKYIRLRSIGEYLVVYLNNNINYSNYSSFHSSLGNSLYSLEIGIAYKGWFLKKEKQY